jgi:hypothetical protein
MFTVFKRSCLFLAAAVVLGAAGCQPAQQAAEPTLTQVAVNTSAPAAKPTAPAAKPGYASPVDQPTEPAAPTGYPVDQPTEPAASTSYPVDGAGNPPAAAPAAENQSKVTAKLLDAAPDPANPGYSKMHVQVLASEDVNGMPNFTSKLVNQEADLYIQTDQIPEIYVNDQFTAMVTYRGDEKGGKYIATEMQKK